MDMIANLEEYKLLFFDLLPQVITISIFAFVAFKAVRILAKFIQKIVLKNADKISHEERTEFEKRVSTIKGILIAIFDTFIWAVIIFFVLEKAGIDVRPLLAGAGIVGLAVGFGAQELVRDIISGMFMIFENQIRKRDIAIINGTTGQVENIGLRTITLRDVSGVVHIFQHGKINSLSNMTKDWSAIVFEIGVAYKENLNKVMDVMKAVGDELAKDKKFKNDIIEPIEIMGVEKFEDSSIIIKARIKTKPSIQWDIGREYRKNLKEAFDANRIEIPFPHMSLYWGSTSEPFQILNNKE